MRTSPGCNGSSGSSWFVSVLCSRMSVIFESAKTFNFSRQVHPAAIIAREVLVYLRLANRPRGEGVVVLSVANERQLRNKLNAATYECDVSVLRRRCCQGSRFKQEATLVRQAERFVDRVHVDRLS